MADKTMIAKMFEDGADVFACGAAHVLDLDDEAQVPEDVRKRFRSAVYAFLTHCGPRVVANELRFLFALAHELNARPDLQELVNTAEKTATLSALNDAERFLAEHRADRLTKEDLS